MVSFSFYFFFECWLEFLIGVWQFYFLQEVYDFYKLYVFGHPHHESLNSWHQKLLKVIQVAFIVLGFFTFHYCFSDVVNVFNRIKPKFLGLLHFEKLASTLVTNINYHRHELVKSLDVLVFRLRIIEWPYIRFNEKGWNNFFFTQFRKDLNIEGNWSLVFALALVEDGAGILYAFVFANLEAVVDWEVVSLHVLHCLFAVLLFAKNSDKL